MANHPIAARYGRRKLAVPPAAARACSLRRIGRFGRLAQSEGQCRTLAEEIPHPVSSTGLAGAIEMRSVLDTMGHIIAIRNDNGFEYLSPSWGLYTGMTSEAPASAEWRSFIHPDDLSVLDAQVRAVTRSGLGNDECELRVRGRDGTYRWFLARTAALADSDGIPNRRINTWTDIHDLKRTQAAFADSEARYRALTESMPQMVWIGDENINIQYVNERWLAYTGLTFEPGMPSKTGSIVHPDDVGALTGAHAALRARGNVDCEMRLRRHDGVYRWHLVRTVPFGDTTDAVRQSIVTATDIEARKAAETALAHSVAEMTHRAHHDPLTRLPNRTKLMDLLATMIAHAESERMNVVVLYLDVDHFKAVNDTLGHDAGDALLVEIAARINGSLRAEDIASRLGGDEFVLVCLVDGVVDAAAVAQRLQAAVRAPIEINGKRVVVASSIGISLFPQDGQTPLELMRKADAAMYSAKQSGRDAWAFYSATSPLPLVPALELELELREAIAREEFVVFYQPIIDIASGRAIGAEALVRWMHPVRGMLGPGEFIAFAEEHGMIGQIGEFVLNAACAQLRRLNLRAGDDFSIAVNVSAHQFAKASFVGTIASAIAAHGIDARRLEIEITESVVMAETGAAAATLQRLRALGVRLSIDDFGTGYSSLAYIKNFPIHTLKIDRSFIADIAGNFTDQAIAKTIVTLAHSLGMRTIAEGVETVDQLERLRAFGADCFQGYLVSRPLPCAEFERFLSTRRSPLLRTV
jgi:diguanylate cyclase (GGDEF)-like protein/PAS domain S-box-containing protein